jgi:hypothetical protein
MCWVSGHSLLLWLVQHLTQASICKELFFGDKWLELAPASCSQPVPCCVQELWHQRTAVDQLTAAGAAHPDPRPDLLQFAELAKTVSPSIVSPVAPDEGTKALLRKVRHGFARLASRCMSVDPSLRPSFDEATLQLDRLQTDLTIAMAAV